MTTPIRVLSREMDILGEIDNYQSMFFDRSWHEIGEFEMVINRHLRYADTLQKNCLILVGNDPSRAFIIKHREIQLDSDGKLTENWVIRGYSLKSIIAQRITYPPSHTAYDNKSGSVETVMKHYINNNIVNPTDPSRRIPGFEIAPDLQRGPRVSYSSRFKNLSEEIILLSTSTGVGWEVRLDLERKVMIFDVLIGNVSTVNQDVRPPVIFSPQFDSLRTMQYIQSELNYKNTAVIGGQGEGIERRLVEITDSTGLDRHEVFIDARDVPEEDDDQQPIPEQEVIQALIERGEQQLSELIQEEYLEGQILQNSPFVYGVDYDRGDVVTLQNLDWGITMDTRITNIKEIYETGFQVEATFGNSRPTIIKRIKQELSQVSGEVRR